MQIEMQFALVKTTVEPDYPRIILSTKLIILLLNYDSACKNDSIISAAAPQSRNKQILLTDTNFGSIVRRKILNHNQESDWLAQNMHS